MPSLFDGLLISCPNDGGLFLVHGGRATRLDSLHCTGLDVREDAVLRGLQPRGLALTGRRAWTLGGDGAPFDDIHDVLFDGDGCYVVGTTGNEVVRFDGAGVETGRWRFSEEKDSWHLNCLARWNGAIVFSAFGTFASTRGYKGATDGAGFVQELVSGHRRIEGLSQPHSLVPYGRNLLVANSERKEVREYAPDGTLLRVAALDGYTRGICVVGDLLYVGLSCSRNIDEAHLPSATVVALDMATWAEKGRVRLNAREIYSIVAVPDPDRLVRALGPLSESIVDRLTDALRDREGLAVRLEQRVADCEAQMQEKDSAWSERVIQVAADHVAEIRRIAQERDAMLADKDRVWSDRVEQTALDHQVEIARIASERDAMLVDKDRVWSDRVRQTALDHQLEIARIATERDALLADKDAAWSGRVEQTAKDYQAEIARIALERDAMLADKDAAWQARIDRVESDFRSEIARLDGERRVQLDRLQAQWADMVGRVLPKVSVVTVNFNGKAFLSGLIDSLMRQTFAPAEIIVVDNASVDGSVEFLREHYPSVKVVRSEVNLGFAGGNNLGVHAASGAMVALINNDTVASETWLERLVSTWVARTSAGERIGAVSPKIVYFKPFLQFRFRAPVFSPGGGDSRMLGVAVDLSKTSIAGVDYLKPIVGDGFYHEERWPEGRVVRWTGAGADLMLPVDESQKGPQKLRIVVTTAGRPEGVDLEVECEGRLLGCCRVREGFAEFEFDIPADLSAAARWVVNNAGSRLDGFGNASDIGINQPDAGQFDNAGELEAFCGCSVLMPRSLFIEQGGFDERFFMYYEDVDLSWRIRNAGWKLLLEPRSIVRHIHAGSSGEWSPGFRYHVTRNYRLNGFKNARFPQLAVLAGLFARALINAARLAGRAGWQARRGVALTAMTPAQIELKALLDAASMIPKMLGERVRALLRKEV